MTTETDGFTMYENKEWYENLRKVIAKKFEHDETFISTDGNVDEFLDLVKKHNIKISGSTVLQAVSGEIFDNYDFDLVVNKITDEMVNDFKSYIENIRNKEYDRNPKWTKKSVINEWRYYECKDKGGYFGIPIEKLVIFECDQTINCVTQTYEYIQLIQTSNMFEYFNSYDLDICKNYFDGTNFYVFNLQNILYKRTFYSPLDCNTCNNINNRIKKYTARGYKIYFDTGFVSSRYKDIPYMLGIKTTNIDDVTYETKKVVIDYVISKLKKIN